MGNLFKTLLVLSLLTLLAVFIGSLIGGQRGMFASLGFACFMMIGVYWAGGRIVLAMHRAQPLAEDEAPEVFEIVKRLSLKAGVPMPRLYVLPSASANAFSAGWGPKHAAIAVTHGLVGLLNKEELSGVLGHEVSHILSRDILLASVVATLAGAISLIASMFRGSFVWGGERDDRDRENPLPLVFFAAVMPFAALLIRSTISRSWEYEADEKGARLCEEPLYLASALRKMEAHNGRFPLRDAAPASAHLFISDPLPVRGWLSFFKTHPLVEDRIARLENLEAVLVSRNRYAYNNPRSREVVSRIGCDSPRA